MYVSTVEIENFRCFGDGESRFTMRLRRGLTALVGENDAGKTAVIDALRYALGTVDQEWCRLEDADFHRSDTTREIRITCRFDGLRPSDKRASVEHLTYLESPEAEPVLYIHWTAKDAGRAVRGRAYRRIEVRSGKDGSGPILAPGARELLCAAYLRPLRDAEQALCAGRGSRLAQVLRHSLLIGDGADTYTPGIPPEELSVLGISSLVNALLERQQAIVSRREEIDRHLSTSPKVI